MTREQAKAEIKQALNGELVDKICCSEKGCLCLLDDIYVDFVENNRHEYYVMQTNTEYNALRGGWQKFVDTENDKHINRFLDLLEENGYTLHSVDFANNEGEVVLFVSVEKEVK